MGNCSHRRRARSIRFALPLLGLGWCLHAEPSASFIWETSGSPTERLDFLGAVSVAPDGRVWAADASGRFFIFDASGRLIETWGERGEGPGEFRFVAGNSSNNARWQVKAELLFLADGSFYVMDPANNRIQRFSADRRFLGAWGTGDGGVAAPSGLALRGPDELIVSYIGRSELHRFDLDGHFLGILDLGLGQQTSHLAVDGKGRIHVAMELPPQANARPRGLVRVFDADGNPLGAFGAQEPGFGGLSYDFALVIDELGRYVVADEWNQRVIVFSPEGKPILTWGERGTSAGRFNRANDVSLGPDGSVYVADRLNRRLQKFKLSGW